MHRLPIVASKLDDKDKFDSLVIVANDLDKDLGRISQLNEHFAHLKTIKEVIYLNILLFGDVIYFK